MTADSQALQLGALGGFTTGKRHFPEVPGVSQNVTGGGSLRPSSPRPHFTDGETGGSLAITGKEAQKSGNNHNYQVLLSTDSVLRILHALFCLIFSLTPAGRSCLLSPFTNAAMQFPENK